jgi:hypothetical protein
MQNEAQNQENQKHHDAWKPCPNCAQKVKTQVFETLFNVTLDIDGRIMRHHKIHPVEESNTVNFTISQSWNGFPTEDVTQLSLCQGKDDTVDVTIFSTFFGEPPPPLGKSGDRYFHLWDYEAVELLFLNKKQQYLELQVGPHGQYLVVLLNGRRKVVR